MLRKQRLAQVVKIVIGSALAQLSILWGVAVPIVRE